MYFLIKDLTYVFGTLNSEVLEIPKDTKAEKVPKNEDLKLLQVRYL